MAKTTASDRIARPLHGQRNRCIRWVPWSWAWLTATLILAFFLPTAELRAEPWKILRTSDPERSCHPGIGFAGGLRGQVLRTRDCAILIIEKPDGIGWIDPSNRQPRGGSRWYKMSAKPQVDETTLAAFIGILCEKMSAFGAVAQARKQTVFFQCVENDQEVQK